MRRKFINKYILKASYRDCQAILSRMNFADIFKTIVCLYGRTVNFLCKLRSQSSVNVTHSSCKLLRLANIPSGITLRAFEDKYLRRSYSNDIF